MKYRYIGLFTMFLFSVISCNVNPTMIFEVINNSKEDISKIQISATGSKEIETIELDNAKYVKYKLDMSGIPKTDGAYKIEFKREGETQNKTFGYYTNGYPINNKYIIDITDNGINIKEE